MIPKTIIGKVIWREKEARKEIEDCGRQALKLLK